MIIELIIIVTLFIFKWIYLNNLLFFRSIAEIILDSLLTKVR